MVILPSPIEGNTERYQNYLRLPCNTSAIEPTYLPV